MNYYPQYGIQQIPNYYQYQYQPQYSTLNGKIVENVDAARNQDVPIGLFGVFPKADQSEIYVKQWMPDGTTKVTTYTPIVEQKQPDSNDQFSEIQKQIAEINKKLDGMKPHASPAVPMTKRKKEGNDDE